MDSQRDEAPEDGMSDFTIFVWMIVLPLEIYGLLVFLLIRAL